MKQWKVGLKDKLRRIFSSNDKVRTRSCVGKVQYSKESSVRAATLMAEKKSESFDAYECAYCKKYHIGHSKGWKIDVASRSGV